MRRPLRVTVVLASSVAALAVLACSRPSETVQTADLLRLLVDVPHDAEKRVLDIGTAEDQGFTEGLSWNEETADGTTFSWSDGPTTTLTFFLAEARPARLLLRGLPRPEASEDGGQSFEAVLNGRSLGSRDMDGSVQELALDVPSQFLTPGRNQVELRYSSVFEPLPNESEQRALGVAWDWVRLELETSTATGAPPISDLLRNRLVLTPGSWVEYTIELEPGSELVIDRVAGDAALIVGLRDRPTGLPNRVERLEAGTVRLRLPTDPTQTVWLTLSNPGPEPLRLQSPRIEARRAPIAP
ncbi:MAG: hypothetical protein AAGK22_02290 [Acidobacteriota bacterium]